VARLWDRYVVLKKRRPSLSLDHLSQGLELWKKWTYCSLDFSREQYKKRDLWSLSASSPVRLFSRFLCGEQLTQDFAFPTAHTPLDAWRKPFYSRPSDCCFRFAYSVALLIPITKRPSHPRASAWWPRQLYYMTVQIRHIDLSIGLRPLNGYRKL